MHYEVALLSFMESKMGKKLYVGNQTGGKLYIGHLPGTFANRDLQQLFKPHGTVRSAEVVIDPSTGRSKGFGFVEMGSDQEAQAAIAAVSGREVDGMASKGNEEQPKKRGGRRS
jgi:cold-inducible RNA-binding protein